MQRLAWSTVAAFLFSLSAVAQVTDTIQLDQAVAEESELRQGVFPTQIKKSTETKCGPPLYPCTQSNDEGIYPPVTYPFAGQGSAPGADNTLVVDPEPGGLTKVPVLRLTNAKSGCGASNAPACPVQENSSFSMGGGSSADTRSWALDSSSLYVVDNNAWLYFFGFDPSIQQASFWYTNYGCGAKVCDAGFFMPKTPSYSTLSATTLYGTGADSDAFQIDGPAVYQYTLMDPPALPTHTKIDSLDSLGGTGAGCLPSTIISATDPLGVNYGDTVFIDGFSTQTVQNTARYVVIYDRSVPGTVTCYVWKTDVSGPGSYLKVVVSNGVPLAFGGSVTCKNCGSGITNPGTFPIHNVRSRFKLDDAIVETGTCDEGSTCYNNDSPYYFDGPTGNVYALCNGQGNSLNLCGGHWSEGANTWFNAQGYNLVDATVLNAGMIDKPIKIVPKTSISCPTPYGHMTWDSHMGYQNAMGPVMSDSAILTMTFSSETEEPNYNYCFTDEIVGVFPSARPKSTFKRFGHTFTWPTACFGAEIGLGQISPDGKWFAYTSTMHNGLGCTDGSLACSETAACNSTSNGARGDVFIQPLW